jgi:hypothetical protein
METKTKLSHNWTIWYHHEKDNWKLSGYKNIYEINTVGDFWRLYNNWHKVKGVNSKHFFLMKDNITPLWEDAENINGGCWSFKVTDTDAEKLWTDLSTYIVCNQLSTDPTDIIGLSICLKKNNFSVIKIWNKNSKNNSLLLLNEFILKKWGMDIIYIAHIPD